MVEKRPPVEDGPVRHAVEEGPEGSVTAAVVVIIKDLLGLDGYRQNLLGEQAWRGGSWEVPRLWPVPAVGLSRSLASDSGMTSWPGSKSLSPVQPTQVPWLDITMGATAVTRPPALQERESPT